MEESLSNLPTWGILVLGVVWLAFKFVAEVWKWNEKKRDEQTRKDYRDKRHRERTTTHSGTPNPSVRPQKPRREDTGRHDIRAVLEEERQREQHLEMLANTRDHTELMGSLIAAEAKHTALLERMASTLEQLAAQQSRNHEQQTKNLQALSETQRAIMRYLRIAVGDVGVAAVVSAELEEGTVAP